MFSNTYDECSAPWMPFILGCRPIKFFAKDCISKHKRLTKDFDCM